MNKTNFRAMGCNMLVAVDSPSLEAQEALDLVPVWFKNWERFLSRFRPDSELSRVNASQGATQVSETFWQVLLAAQDAYWQSSGLVTPTLLPALEAAGYDRSFDQMGAVALAPVVELDLDTAAGFEDIEMDAEARSIRLPAHMRLDFGGVAKGWAAHQAMTKLAQLGPVLVDAGGDIAISAPPHGEAGWNIGVADPRGECDPLLVLQVARGGVATSGSDLRHWTLDGQPQHHLIDPRSQRPSDTDVLSATVVGPDLMKAEMASKTALLLGSDDGLAWLEEQPELAGLLITHDGSIFKTQDFNAFILEESSCN